MKTIVRIGFLALFASLAVALFLGLSGRTADGYTPPQSGTTLPVFATPALLAAASVAQLTIGSEAWVTNQGVWSYAPTCPNTCDGANTCRTAGGLDGGVGCWIRSTSGLPGANNIANWYVNSASGNDANNCLSSGTACLTLQEVLSRIANQAVNTTFINLAGSFANFNGVIGGATSAPINGFFALVGQRTYVGTDGGALFNGVVSSYQAWDAGEGIAYVVAAVDGGPAFDPNVWPADAGYILEDTSQCNTSGGTGCTGLLIGPKLDAGTFATPGGVQVFGYTALQPSVGDNVRIAALTPVGTAGLGPLQISADNFDGINVFMGFGNQEVEFSPQSAGSPSYFESSILVGGIAFPGGVLVLNGTSTINFTLLGGSLSNATACYFDSASVVENGYFFVSSPNNLVGPGGLQIGALGSDGPCGMRLAAGPMAVEGYTSAGLGVFGGSHVTISTANLLFHNSAGSSHPAIQVESGGSYVAYASGFAPTYSGTASTSPWILAGTGTDAGLPQVCTGTVGCGIVVKQ